MIDFVARKKSERLSVVFSLGVNLVVHVVVLKNVKLKVRATRAARSIVLVQPIIISQTFVTAFRHFLSGP